MSVPERVTVYVPADVVERLHCGETFLLDLQPLPEPDPALVDEVVRFVEANPGSPKRAVVKEIHRADRLVYAAIDAAVAGGRVRVARGARRAEYLFPVSTNLGAAAALGEGSS